MNALEYRKYQIKNLRHNWDNEEKAIKDYTERIERPNILLSEILRYLDSQIGLGLLYYPGCGFDIVPRDTLGYERVVHVSLQPEHYFRLLGEGKNIAANYIQSPFHDNSFGSCLIWNASDSMLLALDENSRVTKQNGLIVLGDASFKKSCNFVRISNKMDSNYERLTLQDKFSDFRVYRNI
ncbi:hypothetical protein J4440_01020 [Candidatus Woesearchaeota archaeon]|nr:hypothetical protein [Candidatus Woesearchaeota archaeon]